MDSLFSIDILGSCVTRDVFTDAGGDQGFLAECRIAGYWPRSSFTCMVEPPLQVRVEELKSDSKFRNKVVLQDAARQFVHRTPNPGAVLVVDFIDQVRHSDVRICGTRLTLSQYLVESGYMQGRKVKEIPFAMRPWKKACNKVVKHIVENYSVIIVNESYYCKRAINAPPDCFDDQSEVISKYNARLEEMCAHFMRRCPKAFLLKAEEWLMRGDGGNKWGLAPYHYVQEFYSTRLSQIRDLVRRIT